MRFEEQRNTVIPQEEVEAPLSSSWYHPIEYRQMQLDARNTLIALLRAGNDPFRLDPSEHCLRGLEKHQFPPHVRAVYRARNKQFIKLITAEYIRLREAGVPDAELQLHMMSAMYSVPAKTYALHLALSGSD